MNIIKIRIEPEIEAQIGKNFFFFDFDKYFNLIFVPNLIDGSASLMSLLCHKYSKFFF